MPTTISETIDSLHDSLRQYIEATYHIGHPQLIAQRRALLDAAGVIHQHPFIESTPRYQSRSRFEELGLPSDVLSVLDPLCRSSTDGPQLLYNPPYHHQAAAITGALVDEKSLLVMTGTGSGKTECFLLPLLGKLAVEAAQSPESFTQPAMRALILYPMNALVNDQLSRLRVLFGDDRLVKQFIDWSGRPIRFARYTSRTLYPGVRHRKKDAVRLKSIETFYVDLLDQSNGPSSEQATHAAELIEQLKSRGRWPAKPDLAAWYGRKGSWWQKNGQFVRAVTQPRDSELFTRHEVHQAPSDILVTNYSMLEYMLMRPLERPVFDMTRDWLARNPSESFMLVVDEAHMYRGAAGAEVALLLRRLRERLEIPSERLQVVCTSASFEDREYAVQFAARLTGKKPEEFAEPIQGTLALQTNAGKGTAADADVLASIDLDAFHDATGRSAFRILQPLLEHLNASESGDNVPRALYDALSDFAPMGELINRTMRAACAIDQIGAEIFPEVDKEQADRAVTVLGTLGSIARKSADEPGLLPARVHAFFRGLPGLWACLDQNCSDLQPEHRGEGPTGRLFSQPRDRCACGARVLELFTCRNCGTAYARAYTDDRMNPVFLWEEPGTKVRTAAGTIEEYEPLDLLLEPPVEHDVADLASYDLLTGQIDPEQPSARLRDVFLSKSRFDSSTPGSDTNPGQFRPCAVCGGQASFGRSSVQDHQTKGDQPFQALVTAQIHAQTPTAPRTDFAPLQGRKVLTFADSRQTAARLAPNLQTYSMRDVMRPLIVYGFSTLEDSPRLGPRLSLNHLYLAVLLAAQLLRIRLRPTRRVTEPFAEIDDVRRAVESGAPNDDDVLADLALELASAHPPHSLLRDIISTISHRYYSLESLALASIREAPKLTRDVLRLPAIPGYAESDEQKLALTRLWLRAWRATGFHLPIMPSGWYGDVYNAHSGKFASIKKFIVDPGARREFERNWLPRLHELFTEQVGASKHQLRGGKLSLLLDGQWAYCQRCRETQRPFPGRTNCVNCAADHIQTIDPDTDPVFAARKGYYRASTLLALSPATSNPMSLVAAEHTAQIGGAQGDEVFSKAEEHELLFQDIDITRSHETVGRTAIDILSCTTTMEVGIDIGSLSGVALRNMPPARANYQQRAGRAGRRGSAIATVTAFGSADSHDEHYFSHPQQMIRGQVADPILNVDNSDIARRHVIAFLLQKYHAEKLPDIAPEDQPQLFAVLGTVADFRQTKTIMNLSDFKAWLSSNAATLRKKLDDWLPEELDQRDRQQILEDFSEYAVNTIASAIGVDAAEQLTSGKSDADGDVRPEVQQEEGEERPINDPGSDNLLDRLLFKGVLPRYAFPTDVATFHVFDQVESTRYRPVFQYAPSQGLPTALSQYAPGKQVWINNRLWTSNALYSVMPEDRYQSWLDRKLYFECQRCEYSLAVSLQDAEKGDIRDCPACGDRDSFGPARYWLRPPGFAHPIEIREGTSPDDQPAKSYATRAKLTAPITTNDIRWHSFHKDVRSLYLRDYLLVTNRGPKTEGYSYCTKCGRIEPTIRASSVMQAHRKPFPMPKDQNCPGGGTALGLVLGTSFITDVLLLSIDVPDPISLRPGLIATDVALRTTCEALTAAACDLLELERSELQADFRPSLTDAGKTGRQAEIYIYDTLAGGAGFARSVEGLGHRLLEHAWSILVDCPEACDRSCYRCLRSYQNKFEHELLDRHLGSQLLRFMIDGGDLDTDYDRLAASANLLFEDLVRHEHSGIQIQRSVSLTDQDGVVAPILITKTDGKRMVVDIHSALTPNYASTAGLRNMCEYSLTPVYLVDETLVRRNLPNATRRVLDAMNLN